jgi:hypothetical protein
MADVRDFAEKPNISAIFNPAWAYLIRPPYTIDAQDYSCALTICSLWT